MLDGERDDSNNSYSASYLLDSNQCSIAKRACVSARDARRCSMFCGGSSCRPHVRPQHCVHPGLITRTLSAKPFEYVHVDPERDRLLQDRWNKFRGVPEILGEICQLWRRGALDLRVSHAAKPGKIRSTRRSGLRFRNTLLCGFVAHGVCSHGLK